MIKITFLPDNKIVETAKGKTILSAAQEAGIHINSSCGGTGVCGRCKVIQKRGKANSLPTGKLTLDEKKRGYILACRARTEEDIEIEIPKESRLDSEIIKEQDLALLEKREIYSETQNFIVTQESLKENIFAHSPLATKLYLELPRPTLEDKISDVERLLRAIRKIKNIDIMQIGLKNIRKLGQLLRSNGWKVTVTLGKRNNTTEIVLVEPGDTAKQNYGFAFDIGTTTISGQLVDLNTKKIIGSRLAYNKQAHFGSDVITRIIFAQKEEGLHKLHLAVTDEINLIIEELIKENKIDIGNVSCCVVAGNTTMIHLLLEIDPTYIRRDPYTPTANFVPVIRAIEAGIKVNPRGLLGCLPGVSSYVGGDISAGVAASGLNRTEKTSLLIDIGTNGEIVLGNKDWLISAAASAGPAFEGSGVTCGMRASSGAIQRITISPKTLEVNYSTINDKEACGICGSGYIDAIAQMLGAGILDKNGKIASLKHKRIRDGEYGREFIIAHKEQAGTSLDIVITEMDIENIKRAKGAIYAAAASLVKHMGLEFESLDKIFISGGFGTYLNMKNAVNIGLLPNLPEEKYLFIGNSSLNGARLALLSLSAYAQIEEIAAKMAYLELSAEPSYYDEYVAALFFPHTDITKFSKSG